ncbi:MAG: histidine phosphatase family protein [Phycisphaerales bacterium JB043]
MPKDESFDVLLVRAGATPWDAVHRIQGHTDLPLTDEARQAFEQHLDDIDLPALTLIASGKEESVITCADVLASRFESPKRKKSSDLQEINLGLWEGLLESDAQERYSKAYGAWEQDPTTVTPPDGESLADVDHRVAKAVRKILEKASSPIAIVVRPITWGVLVCRAKDIPLSELWDVIETNEPTMQLQMSPAQFKARPLATEAGT